MPAPQKRLISLKASAEYLDVTTKSVRDWIAQGRLTGYRVGRHIKLDANEVDAFAAPIPTAKAGA